MLCTTPFAILIQDSEFTTAIDFDNVTLSKVDAKVACELGVVFIFCTTDNCFRFADVDIATESNLGCAECDFVPIKSIAVNSCILNVGFGII
ncbi:MULTISPECIES: hypothetical protein [Pseudanabaena]|uniref:Uncharacterized protein n=1 Tax=Pseudanabaena catenata USMAC16 TaxID=1855837 RepID=A0A9X4RJ63_9CYAN|nr:MULTISPECIES: hypothetical protein [Pseudanabaena]MDG3496768.1 hypothetical protein [Pseudanabaena catenata USMAC16]